MPKKNDIIIVSVTPPDGSAETTTAVRDRTTVEMPGKYNVIMHNDDVTPMGFVVEILVDVYNKKRTDAIKLMLSIHNNGKGVAGTYPRSIAESKISRTREIASNSGYDEFKVTMEKA